MLTARSRRADARLRHPAFAGWDRPGARHRRRRRERTTRLVGIALVGMTVGGASAVILGDGIDIRISGVEDGAVVDRAQAEAMAVEVDVSGFGASDVRVAVNGVAVEPEESDGSMTIRPGSLLRDGTNEIVVRVDGRAVFADRTEVRRFDAVLEGASVALPAELLRPADGEPIELAGLVDDAVALEVDGVPVPPDGGAFRVQVAPSATQVVVRARHANGNVTEQVVPIVAATTPAPYAGARAVHVSARGWADPEIRASVLAMAAAGSIDAVQLDVKDESGEIGYQSGVQLATDAGASRPHYDPAAAIAELREHGVRVIGRIVCFLDPVVAGWAWASGRPEMVVQAPGGAAPISNDYGTAAFVNYADPVVQQYLVDVAVEAAGLGFDEILYDYVRRPEGPLESMVVPGLTRAPEVEIARFVRDTAAALEPFGTELGVSVFGIAATRPRQIAQDMRLLAPHVDYVSPMVYPSHWGPGEYGVDSPVRQPADIVQRSIADFVEVVAGSGAAVVPWLQAFDSGDVTYGPAQVRAQIDAAAAAGATGFILWNAGSTYDAAALGTPP